MSLIHILLDRKRLSASVSPRFVDIRPDTLNLDETRLDREATSRTCAVVPMHYAGVPCEMGPIQSLARRGVGGWSRSTAQALGATYRQKPVGTFGVANAFSFHETKNVSCGEGGALAITDQRLIARAEIVPVRKAPTGPDFIVGRSVRVHLGWTSGRPMCPPNFRRRICWTIGEAGSNSPAP